MVSLLMKAFSYAYPFLIEILLGSENSKRKEISVRIIAIVFLVSLVTNVLLLRGIYNVSKDKITLTETIELLNQQKIPTVQSPITPDEPVKDREPRKPQLYTNEKKVHKNTTHVDELDKLKHIDGIR